MTTTALRATTTSDTLRRVAEAQGRQADAARASTATAGISGSVSDGRQLNANFDMFLQLLTTQLRNQNPLDPMKTEQFAQQITQFSAVEQQIKTNSMLERLITAQTAGSNTAALGFLGNEVVARGAAADLRGGEARWTLTSPRVGTATIMVRDAQGQVVYTEQRTVNSGQQEFRWNGRGSNGTTLPDGTYTIAIDAKGADQQPIDVTTSARGRVTAVDLSGPEPVLTVGNARVKLSEVTSVSVPSR
jgi:flagellar basal-body rod modification protein FlgD